MECVLGSTNFRQLRNASLGGGVIYMEIRCQLGRPVRLELKIKHVVEYRVSRPFPVCVVIDLETTLNLPFEISKQPELVQSEHAPHEASEQSN